MSDDNPIWQCYDECFVPAHAQDRTEWSTRITVALVIRRWLEHKGYSEEEIDEMGDRVVQGLNFDFWAAARGLRKSAFTHQRHHTEKTPMRLRIYPIKLKPEYEKKFNLRGVNKLRLRMREVPVDWKGR